MSQILFAYNAHHIKLCEQIAYEQFLHLPWELMLRAGESAFRCVRKYWPQAQRIDVYCGSGNNGGDGYVLALLAQQHGLDVRIIYLEESKSFPATQARAACEAAHVPMHAFVETNPDWPDLIVDALLGIGIKDELRTPYTSAINHINQTGKPVLAIDVPTGVNADTGNVQTVAVQASKTLTFIALKSGLLTGPATNFCGDVILDDLNLPTELFAQVAPAAELMNWQELRQYLPPRAKNSNKGSFGHVLVVGGNLGMPGAVRMAGEAAARVGAGLVTLATRPEHAAVIASQRPELLCYGINSAADLEPLLARAKVLVIGPGLGQDAWAQQLWELLLSQTQLKIMDADALNLLAVHPKSAQNWILTPHPGEAARLLQCSVDSIQQDRFSACQKIQQRYGGVVVLKGAGSLVQRPGKIPLICRAGNPGMASAGMGDVLSGILGGLLAQGLSVNQAAAFGVMLHSMAADKVAQKQGERGMLACDLMPELTKLINY